MIYRLYSLRRLLRKLLRQRFLLVLFLLLLIWETVPIIQIQSTQIAAAASLESPKQNTQRIYIACQHWNTERILRSHWNNALVDLVRALGPDKVFVSIFESGSYDNTKGALRELDGRLEELNVSRNITLSEISHKDEITQQPTDHGWIQTPLGTTELRRIPFLAQLRNRVLEPLEALTNQGETFDKVLFLNDVVFTTDDVLTLLDTNSGDYAAACSLDFSKPPAFYDTFALRDSRGHEAIMPSWPYFRSRASRNALESNKPVPVSSCWNGMVSMPAAPFISKNPLRFRGLPDSLAAYHLEASECCLIHADNPLSSQKGIFVNPTVRVGYSGEAYAAMHSEPQTMSVCRLLLARWKNRILRRATTPIFKEMVVHWRLWRWRKDDPSHEEPGEFCIVNEMQVLMERGWKHV